MKTRLARRLNDYSLRNKIIFSIAVFLMLPSLAISLFVSVQIRSILFENAYHLSEENVYRAVDRTRDAMEIALSISDRLSLDPDLERLLNTAYADPLGVFLAYRGYTRIDDFTVFSPIISRIKIYADNETLLNNWSFIPLTETVRAQPWFRAALEADGANLWLSFTDITKNRDSIFSLVRMISFPQHGTKGVLVIDLDTARLSEMLAQESFDTFLVDDEGLIFAAGDAEKRGVAYRNVAAEMPELDADRGTYSLTIDSSPYRMLYEHVAPRNSANGITIVSLLATQTITAEVNQVWALAATVLITVFVLGLAFLVLVYSGFVRRLVAVSRGMDVVAGGHFHSFLDIDGSDEIGQLVQRFNNMVSNIQELMDEVHRSNEERLRIEKHQADIKLKMLASQINPHFLFNSLESIRMKAHMEKKPEIADVVKRLGVLMRRILEVEGNSAPLSDEIETIRTYLAIEQFRLDERLRYEIHVPDSELQSELPPLLLQPLVENAVVHGVERSTGPVRVYLGAEQRDDRLRFVVEDNGRGMTTDQLESLRRRLGEGANDEESDSGKPRHIGLSNVQQRLVLTYGRDSGLVFSLPEDGGFRVQFSIPVKQTDVHVDSSRRRTTHS
ncbi:MAG: cache domain-containing sensor histidine kinase [Spirochaetota bacterium]